MARGTLLVSVEASRLGRDIVTCHRRGPMSRQPARDSHTEQGLPTHVPQCRGSADFRATQRCQRTRGQRAWGGVVYSRGLLPQSPSLYEQGAMRQRILGSHTPPCHRRTGVKGEQGGGGTSTDRSKHGEQQAPHQSGKSTWYGGARSGDTYSGKSSSYEGGTRGLSGSGPRAGVPPCVEPDARGPGGAFAGAVRRP